MFRRTRLFAVTAITAAALFGGIAPAHAGTVSRLDIQKGFGHCVGHLCTGSNGSQWDCSHPSACVFISR